MGFFGPDYNKIGNDYADSANKATNTYVGKMTGYANIPGSTTAQNFSGSDVLGDVNAYLDPSMNAQIKEATGAIQNAYGGKGSLFSGAAGRAVGENARAMAERGWGDAFARATGARQNEFNNAMGIDTLNNTAAQQTFGNFNDIYGTQLGNSMNIANQKAQLAASAKSPWDYVMDAGKLGTGIGSMIASGGLV
jgi:hypothetical protein